LKFIDIALANFIKINPNPNGERRRFAPPLTIWVWCPNKNGDSYILGCKYLRPVIALCAQT